MNSMLESKESVTDPEVLAARREVEQARAALAERLGVASESGRHMIQSAMHNAKPILISLAGLAAVGLAFGIAKASRMPSRRSWGAPRQPSLLGNMLRSALVSAAATLAGRMMQRIPLGLPEPGSPAVGKVRSPLL